MAAIQLIVVRTPKVTVKPLIHSRPRTGLEAKFSLKCAVVAALLDEHIGFATFSDEQACRPEAATLIELVEVELTDGGEDLLSGEVEVAVHMRAAAAEARPAKQAQPRDLARTRSTVARWRTRPAHPRTRPLTRICDLRSRPP